MELASGEVATPTSPIPPALESGEMVKKGTEVVIVLMPRPLSLSFTEAAKAIPEKAAKLKNDKTNDLRFEFIAEK